MENDIIRAEIIAIGFVQGVGFRHFVYQNAKAIGVTGYVKNLYTGEVLTIAEGEKFKIEELFNRIKIGPSYSRVSKVTIEYLPAKNEFKNFEVRYI